MSLPERRPATYPIFQEPLASSEADLSAMLPYDLAEYFPEGRKPEISLRLARELSKSLGGGGVRSVMKRVPMICRGAACPMVRDKNRDPEASPPGCIENPPDLTNCSCPLYAVQQHPEGESCPLEGMEITQIIRDLCQEMQVNPTEASHRHLIFELASLMMLHRRLYSEMSRNPDLLMEEVTETLATYSREYQTEVFNRKTTTKENPVINVLLKIEAMIEKKRKDLMATPNARLNAKMTEAKATESAANSAARLQEILNAGSPKRIEAQEKNDLVKKVLREEGDIEEGEFEVVEEDGEEADG